MKRRGFFGVMAGIFGAPVAAGLVTVTKQANDVFGDPGKLQELKPLASEMHESFSAMSITVSTFRQYSPTWEEMDADSQCAYDKSNNITRCKFCGVRGMHCCYTNCKQCGAPL